MNLKYILIIVVFCVAACNSNTSKKNKKAQNETPAFVASEGGTALFDGKTMEGWEVTNFGTEGPVNISEGKIVINMGDGCSGITYTQDFPKVNYEVNLEARRTVGNDFFCGMTFPVKEEFCSFVIGGWGGPVLGLSCIDGLDASDNETNTMMRFDKGVWYKIKLQVTDENIAGWIDGEKLVDFNYTGHELSTRPEVDLSKPFGICTWTTTGEIRNIWMKNL